MDVSDEVEFATVEDARKAMSTFAAQRGWERFHTPRNLLLALIGEVGELSEIFQWKGDLGAPFGLGEWPAADVVHVGEELSDVLFYLVRLADRCGIDLGAAMIARSLEELWVQDESAIQAHASNAAGGGQGRTSSSTVTSKAVVSGVTFSHYNLAAPACAVGTLADPGTMPRPRSMIISLSRCVGAVAACFDNADGDDSASLGLPNWPSSAITRLSSALADVALCVIRLAGVCGVQLGAAAARKMMLNRKKYPVQLAYGRSDKYTAYAHTTTPVGQ